MIGTTQILLVDDDDVDRMIVRRALQESGLNFDLTEAVDGAEALEACEKHRFDCVFLDYRLPDSDGAAVFKAIIDDYDSSAAVIFLTGENDEALALEMVESGAVDYLSKNEISASLLKRAVRYASARRVFRNQLSEMARIDILTGLPNRSVFQEVLAKAVAQSKRSGHLVAMTLLDLDHFKQVNDTMGHPAGDQLLKKAADRLSSVVRETDTLVRLGGDEFAVIAANLNDAQGAGILAQKLVDKLSAPFKIDGQELFVSTSIGIALAPIDGSDCDELLKNADLALYKAKTDGRGRFHFFDAKMNSIAQEQRRLEAKIRRALANGEFELYYQPKLDISTGEVLGTECLIRWNQPETGMIPPIIFIPVAEKHQLIVEIGDWVLQEACRQNVVWQQAGIPPLNCSVNVSPLQLKNSRLIESIDTALETTGFNPTCLEIEITESSILDNVDGVSALLELLRERGVSVSIDDFGTGYSSLMHLKQLPVDKLKIDRSFVSNIMTNKDDAEITSAIVSLSNKLGLETIAEGVETKSQLDFLRREGCNQAQGYYLSRPLHPDRFIEWYRQHMKFPKILGTQNDIRERVSNRSSV